MLANQERRLAKRNARPGEELVEIFVATEDEDAIVGVAVVRTSDEPSCYVCSIGVVTRLQNKRIGTSLKKAVIREFSERHPGMNVESDVHKDNEFMLKINQKLGAATDVSDEHPDYLFTVVKLEDVTPSR
jgi:RimJ/RimL family protein N-acetyltransferase